MLRLSEDTLALLDSKPSVCGSLAEHMDVALSTILRWIKANDIMLTTADVLEHLEKELGLTRKQMLKKYLPVEIQNK